MALLALVTLVVLIKSRTTDLNNRSAVYTPYHLTPGGGERVVLNFVQKIQYFTGQHVDLVVNPGNACTQLACVQSLAGRLGVDGIDWKRISVVFLSKAQRSYSV